MQGKLTAKPEEAVAAIHALDLESVKLKVMDAELGEGWTRAYANSIEAAYKTWLTMLVKYPDNAEDILVSKDVDEFWHAHILHTRKYAEDCQNVFGSFLHHNPHIGHRTTADAERQAALAEKTRSLYQRERGTARAAERAWAGASIKVKGAAYCGAAISAEKAAYCGATVKPEKAAYCGATITAEKAAYCGAAITAQKAAYRGATIKPERAAYCGATINPEKAAYCGAAITAEKAAYCGAAVTAPKAAYCGATINPEKAAYCGAAKAS